MNMIGIVTATADLQGDGSYPSYYKIYVNDVAVGTEHSQTSTSTTYSDDVSIIPGDRVQVYMKKHASASTNELKNFRIKASKFIIPTETYSSSV